MPSSIAERTVRRTASTPRRWPSTRGRPRRAAQRPLPSMMIATWAGTASPLAPVATGAVVRSVLSAMPDFWRDHATSSDVHDLLLLGGEEAVGLGNRLVGRLLDLLFVAALVVLAHDAVLLELLQEV